MVAGGQVDHVVLYTWDATTEFLAEAIRIGVAGVVLKSQSASDVVRSVERIVAGDRSGLEQVARGRPLTAADPLSAREQEVLALLAIGMSNREIGAELFVSAETVKTYVSRIFTKLGVSNRVQAAARAADHAVDPPHARLAPVEG